MNIKELRYYHDLVIQKNFSKVATHFGVAQPTITMAIQRLERELGAPLFIRSQSHHDLTVTASGLQFDQHVQTILRELEVAHQELSRAKQERIRFGLPPIIGNYFFPAYTPALLAAGLLQRLEVEDHGSRELTKMLHRHGPPRVLSPPTTRFFFDASNYARPHPNYRGTRPPLSHPNHRRFLSGPQKRALHYPGPRVRSRPGLPPGFPGGWGASQSCF